MNQGGFIKFIKGNTTLTDATSTISQMIKENWFRNQMIQTVLELMFYNENANIGIIVTLKFYIDNTGQFGQDMSSTVFLPINYKNISDNDVIIKLTLFSISSIGVLYLMIKTIYGLILSIKEFFV